MEKIRPKIGMGVYIMDGKGNLPQPLLLSCINLFKEHPEVLEKFRTFNSFV